MDTLFLMNGMLIKILLTIFVNSVEMRKKYFSSYKDRTKQFEKRLIIKATMAINQIN